MSEETCATVETTTSGNIEERSNLLLVILPATHEDLKATSTKTKMFSEVSDAKSVRLGLICPRRVYAICKILFLSLR
eukprot:643209-Hanusia_phi.AAC.2